MKKFVALLIAVCLAFALFTGCNNSAGADEDAAGVDTSAPEAAVTDEGAADAADAAADAAAAEEESAGIDLDALYASHAPEEVVFSIDGEELTWQDYYYWLYVQVSQIQSYFDQIQLYYGQTPTWEDEIDAESGLTYFDVAMQQASAMVAQLYGIEKYAADNKVALSAEDEEAIAAQLNSDMEALCGADAEEADFDALLSETHLTRELYDRINKDDRLYNRGYIDAYGENGEKVADADAIKYLEDNGYLSAAHILLMTVDAETRESLTEDEIAEKKATAEKLDKELQAIKDEKELAARFAELKAEYCEDTGKQTYPDGYVFTEGTMVSEFENGVKALSDYEVSDVIESSYGYHIIMRLPADADRVISYASTGAAQTARTLYASQAYGEAVAAYIAAQDYGYAEDFAIDITAFVK